MSTPRPPTTSWWTGVPPVEVRIDCRGHSHRLLWADGELTTPDHPGEARRPPVREGGPPHRPADDADAGGCVGVAQGWRAHQHDPRVLVLGRRHPGESLDGLVATLSGDPVARLLTRLDPALERRLQLAAAVALTDRSRGPDAASAWSALEAATASRARVVLDRWLGPGHGASIRLGPTAEITSRPAGPELVLSPDWLAGIWGRYLSIVDGFLVLTVVRIVEDRARVIGVGAPDGGLAVLTLRGPAPWRALSREPLQS